MFTLIGWGAVQMVCFVAMLWCFSAVWMSQQWSGIWRTEDTVVTIAGVVLAYVNYVVWCAAPFTVTVTG